MLKAKISNLGPIREAEIALNDLTIIAGKNNSGKTYISYALYGFLEYTYDRATHFSAIKHFNNLKPEKIVDALVDKGIFHIQITRAELGEIKNKVTGKISKGLFDRVHDFFSTSQDYFKNTSILITDDAIESTHAKIVGNKENQKEIISINYENDKLTFQLQGIQKIEKHFLENLIGSVFLRFLLPKKKIHIESAERFGISLFYREMDFAKNEMVEILQKMATNKKSKLSPFQFLDKVASRYAKPIQDNIDYIRDLEGLTRHKSEFETLANFISEMMGKVKYQATATGIRLISKRKKDNKFNIPLHLASSSARGLVGLYFYFKHIAQKGDWLIIDEPESHFNPENQIQIARLLAMCVNKGIKVLVTTHSDYFIREINNLIMLNQNFDDKQGFLKDYREYNQTMCLSEEKVNGYICENGTLRECQKDKFGIEMDNFDEVIIKSSKISRRLKATITNGDDE